MEKMMRIAIIDDEPVFANKLESIVAEYMNEKRILYSADVYSSGKSFLNLGVEMSKYWIIFLDISMEEQDGIETARKLRDMSNDCFIIFVTAYVKYSIEGYKVGAFRYVLKSDNNFKLAIFESLDAVREKMGFAENKKSFNFREGRKELILNQIVFIESDAHITIFHVLEKEYKIYSLRKTLNDIERELEMKIFIRVHQSYLVNLGFVSKISNYNMYLIDESILPIARSRYGRVRERFALYKGEM